jgi:hypothetical protein
VGRNRNKNVDELNSKENQFSKCFLDGNSVCSRITLQPVTDFQVLEGTATLAARRRFDDTHPIDRSLYSTAELQYRQEALGYGSIHEQAREKQELKQHT